MSRLSLRSILASLVAATVCVAVSPRGDAAEKAQNVAPFERFVATAVSTEDPNAAAAGRIEITIARWSTDQELESLRGALADGGPNMLFAALQKIMVPAGVVQVPGMVGSGARARGRRARNLKFAREVKTPGGRQVVLGADQRLGLGDNPRNFRSSQPEFTLIDIRFGQDGVGVGKVGPGVMYNTTKKTLELENYTKLPERLREVRSEPRPQKY